MLTETYTLDRLIRDVPISLGGFAGILAVTYLASTALQFLYNVYLHPLSSIPGVSAWAAGSDLWSIYHALWTQNRVFKLDEAHGSKGKVVRFAPGMVVVADATYCKEILGSKLSKVSGLDSRTKDRTPDR